MSPSDNPPRRVSDSLAVLAKIMPPQDANPAGNVHGGSIMKFIDDAAAVVAFRHARRNVVTASIDRVNFHEPVYVGDLLVLKASLNCVGKTSMEIGVRVEAEDLRTGGVRHTSSAYLTFVALDDDGHPTGVPGLILEGEEEERRCREANVRRDARLKESREQRGK